MEKRSATISESLRVSATPTVRRALIKSFNKTWKRCWQRANDVVTFESRPQDRRAQPKRQRMRERKKFEKTWKKFLTKDWGSAKIQNRRMKWRVPCKLNNVTENTKHQKGFGCLKALKKACETTVKTFLWSYDFSFNKLIWTAERLFRYHFIESLILAQDERWRRA